MHERALLPLQGQVGDVAGEGMTKIDFVALAVAETSRQKPRDRPLIVEAGQGFNLERHLQDIERSHLERALERSGGVQTRAADVLGLSFRQFRYLAKKYGIK